MVTVKSYQKVVRYKYGKLDTVLEPGRHRVWGFAYSYVFVDVRKQTIDVRPQEVPTSDGINVKVSAALVVRVIDPVLSIEVAMEPESLIYDAAKVAIRDTVRELILDEALRGIAVGAVPDAVAEAAASVGYEVLTYEVRDVLAPTGIRHANDAVVESKLRSLAALESARGEAAVLRTLANSAQVLESHPILATLKMIQSAGESGGTIVIERPSS